MKEKKENKIILNLKLFKRAFGIYRWKIVLLVVTGFLGGLMEGIGINTVIPLFSFIVKGQDKPTDFISVYIEKFFTFFNVSYSLKYLLILIAILFIAKAVMTFLTNYITDRIRTDYIKSTRNKLFNMTIKSNWEYLSKQKIGYMEKILMNDINAYSSMLTYMSSTVILLTNVFIYIFIAFNISPNITLMTVSLGVLMLFIFKPVMDRIRAVSHETSIAQKQVAHHINESMIGIKTIKAMSFEEGATYKSLGFFEKLRSTEMRLSIFASLSHVITQPLSIIIILGVFAYSYKLTTFSFASFAVIVYSINKIVNYVNDGQTRLQNINALYPFLKSVLEFEENATKNKEPYQGKDIFSFKKNIEFKDVSFSYDSKNEILSNINLNINKGEMIGIIGPSGSGKTTFVDLLLSLIKPKKGKILIDDKDMGYFETKSWRKNIGYVSQDVFLVNDTIKNNIKLYDESISDYDMINASKIAYAYDFISKKPLGFDTPTGERGTELSGGQKQRIALARVLARKIDILILDEATSALDNESENAIRKAIEDLRGKMTMFIIAHRPTTVLNVDKIIVIDKGRILEEGSPKELLDRGGSYFSKIYNDKVKFN